MQAKKISFFVGQLMLGGIEQVLVSYANELNLVGYQVEFVVSKSGGLLEKKLNPAIHLVCLHGNRVRDTFWGLVRYVHQNKPFCLITGGDVVNIMCILAAFGTSTRVIVSQHNYNYSNVENNNQGLLSSILPKLMKWCYPKAHQIIAVSNGINDYLVDTIGIDRSLVKVLYNPFDLNLLNNRSNEPSVVSISGNYILFIGRVSPVKNLDFLLDSFDRASLDDMKLVIVGDGSELERLKKKSETLKKKQLVVFTGAQENPLPILKNCKALILCSFSEAFPTVLVEALALRKPIVATPTLGAKEILAGQQGAFIATSFDDTKEFSLLLQQAVASKETDFTSFISNYDKSVIMRKFIDIIEK